MTPLREEDELGGGVNFAPDGRTLVPVSEPPDDEVAMLVMMGALLA